MAFAILQYPRQGHASKSGAQTQQVVAEDVSQHQSPLALFEIRHSFERVAGKRGERSAEAHDHQQSPPRVDESALGGPDHEEAHDEAAHDVDEECSHWEDRTKFSGGEAAEEISKVGADDGGDRYSENIFHDGAPYKSGFNSVGVAAPVALTQDGRIWYAGGRLSTLTGLATFDFRGEPLSALPKGPMNTQLFHNCFMKVTLVPREKEKQKKGNKNARLHLRIKFLAN